MSKSSDAALYSGALDYWQIFRELPESYLLVEADDPDFTIVEMNKERERLTNAVRETSIGRPCFTVYPDTSDEFKKTGVGLVKQKFREVIKTGRPVQLEAMRFDMVDAEGVLRERYWRSTYLPLTLGETARVTHILARTEDITEEQRAEERIASTEQRLEAALAIGKVGSWIWNVTDDVIIGDRNLAALFGMDPAGIAKGVPLHMFIDSIYPEDRQRVQRSIQRTIRGGRTFEEEYRTLTTSGQLRWVLARGKIEKQDGKILFPGVIVDITERRDLQAQIELARRQDQLNRRESKILQKRNEELETISRTKDEFVALASHQLRTPATAVKQYLGMVLQGYAGTISELQTEMLEKAFESNERQIQIINQILNAARVDTGRLALTTMPIDLTELVRGITDDMRGSIAQRKHTLTVRLPRNPAYVLADAGYLRMAIENLLHNASVYTPDGGKIGCHVQRQGNEIRIDISDTGVGIKKADFSKLFTKFSRIHNPLSVQAGGSGIGLYLTAEIVRLHGGTVTVTSQVGRGTTFAILLPLEHNKIKAERGNIPRLHLSK